MSRWRPYLAQLFSFLVLFLAIAATLFFWSIARESVKQKEEQKFQDEVKEITQLVRQRLDLYLNVLYSVQSFLASSRNVENYEWRIYTERLEMPSRYPGILALRYLQRVQAKQVRDFLTNVRHDDFFKKLGYPEFKIHPESNQDEHYVVLYCEPLAGNQWMFGYDVSSDEKQRQLFQKAADDNRAYATGILDVREGRRTPAPGFLIAMPVYQNGSQLDTALLRREALMGFVDIVFKADELLSGLVERPNRESDVELDVYDADGIHEQNLLYSSREKRLEVQPDKKPPRYLASQEIRVAGRRWTLYFTTKPGFKIDSLHENFPWFVLYTGLVISLLLFGVIYSVSLSRLRAVHLADQMTQDLQRALKSKSEFTSTVSHELRTPLAAIKESVSMLEDETLGSINREQKDILSTALRNVNRLSRLINSVLEYQQLDSQKVTFKKTVTDLNALINEVIQGFQAVVRKKKLKLEFFPEHLLPKVMVDKDKITQVLVNFLDNAVKFTDSGSIRVFTQLQGEFARVRIEDDGVGIDPQDIPKLFKDFSQLQKDGSRRTGGTGLGLAISKKIVEAHQGSIGVEPVSEKGSIFFFDLPTALNTGN